MTFRRFKSFKPTGRSYWTDRDANVYPCDNSGTRPERTDDGVLLIDLESIEIERISVAVSKPGDRRVYSMTASGDEARWLFSCAQRDAVREASRIRLRELEDRFNDLD